MSDTDHTDTTAQAGSRDRTWSRRRLLGTAGAALTMSVGLAGCLGSGGSDPFETDEPQGEPVDGEGVTWDDLGDLEGELTVYSGRTRDQIDPLFTKLEEFYPDFSIARDYDSNEAQLNSLVEEGESTPADLFYTQSSGALAALKSEGLARTLPTDVQDAVPENKRDPDGQWTGASGRVRAVQFNSDTWSRSELPTDIFAYATDERFAGEISTRPNSGTFRSFIVAMLELEGEERTREWIRGLLEDQDVTLYSSGTQQAEAVANGEVSVGLGNQYYAARVIESQPEISLDVTFTRNDPGSLFNVSGVAVLSGAQKPNLAAEFVRHVLAVEGQQFFVDTNGEYPVVDGVAYDGPLPSLEALEPPTFDLNELGDLEPAIDLLREEGMTV
ncbi:iron ABC transporter substrate-binding protein [Halodesulfurarchaeum formicicum]|uniref:Iron ABC transporter substrate-binding protein n=1 Tax=Halodesulfurarchaeum formicicum TaxID=1873524 RepID=A0A1D8S1U5_9EURY|nr:extracellular solute-binding protein [Halodesulfurarchaeum formicicum]AOW79328.1 iron ABC transporter substrate-binding protein [Halodesulfurarchaeum formicicum]